MKQRGFIVEGVDVQPSTSQKQASAAKQAQRNIDVHNALTTVLTLIGLPFDFEVKLVPGRNWAWDAVIYSNALAQAAGAAPLIAVEVNGGIHIGGAHGRGVGIQRDYEKQNALVCTHLYCTPIILTPDQLEKGNGGAALDILARAIVLRLPYKQAHLSQFIQHHANPIQSRIQPRRRRKA